MLKGVAIVTGSHGGVGAAICNVLRASGYAVAGLDVKASNEQRSPDFLSLHCDLCDAHRVSAAVREASERLGPISLAVSNAGSLGPSEFVDGDIDAIRRCIDANLSGALFFARACVPAMPQGGTIVFVSSISAVRGSARYPVYAAAKAGLSGLAVSLARRYGPRGIRANVILPGSIAGTGFNDAAANGKTAKERAEERLRLSREIPLRRPLAPSDVANWILFLSQGDCAANGAMITVDGGETWGN